MGSYLMRAIGASQRKVELEAPDISPHRDVLRLTADIQGIHVTTGTRTLSFSFGSMAEEGVRLNHQKPLTLWQRLMRKPACVGSAAELPDGRLRVTFWTDPPTILTLDPQSPGIFDIWTEMHGLVQSAGFSLVV